MVWVARFIPMYENELEKIWKYIINDSGIKFVAGVFAGNLRKSPGHLRMKPLHLKRYSSLMQRVKTPWPNWNVGKSESGEIH
jgi:hypothetical protein